MVWTNIGDTFLEPGKPLRSADLIALRDNPIAVAAGAAGAPGVANAALIDYPWGAEDFQTGTDERDWVLGRNAGAAAGAVGTYVMGRYTRTFGAGPAFGEAVSGSLIESSNTSGSLSFVSLSGTWRAMGRSNLSGSTGNDVTLYLRIS